MMTFLHSRYNFKINLSPKDLLEISEAVSRDFAPEFSTPMPGPVSTIKLSPREMFDISEVISREFAPHALTGTPELMLLPIDPDHLHAYWNLGESSDDTASNEDAGELLTLRIYSEPDSSGEAVTPILPGGDIGIQDTRAPLWFDIEIQSPRAQQTVSLPIHTDETAYSAVIGKRNKDNSLVASTYSNIIHVPRGGIATCQYTDDSSVFKDMPPAMPNSQDAYCPRKTASGQGNIH